MKCYKYKALDMNKKITKGTYRGNSLESLIITLKDKNLFILECKEINESLSKFKKKLSLKEIYIICEQFYELFKAGMSLPKVLYLSSLQSKNDFIANELIKLLEEVSKGESLYGAMKNLKGVYPLFMISMIKIGEESGTLEQVFYKLSKHYYYMDDLKNKIKKSMAYPLVTSVVSFASMILLRIKAIPAFINMLKDMGGTIPLSTKIFTCLFDKGLVFIGIILLSLLISLKSKNNHIQKLRLKIPILSKYILKWEEIKFIKSLSILINSGVDVLKALETVIECTDNIFIKENYNKVLEDLKKGNSLYKSLDSIEVFQKITISMISIGEVSGNLGKVLNNLELILSNELSHKINKISQIIEPTLIIIISIFIGFIIISAIMPIINMTSSINF